MRRTILILATMVVVLVVIGGVALAAANTVPCVPNNVGGCQCPETPGVVCVGTEGEDSIEGTDMASGDKIYALGANDGVTAGSGDDYVDGGKGIDYIDGDDGNDILNGGDDDDVISGNVDGYKDQIIGGPGLNDECYGEAIDDFSTSCEYTELK